MMKCHLTGIACLIAQILANRASMNGQVEFGCKMAAREMSWGHFLKSGRLLPAAILSKGASRMEIASGGRRCRARDLARQDRVGVLVTRGSGTGTARISAAVYGWRGRAENRRGGCQLDQSARHTSPPRDRRYAAPPKGRARQTGTSVAAAIAVPAAGSAPAPAPTHPSAETGSSATTSRGLVASARAMPMRWRCPPLKACGNRCMNSGRSPTRRSSSATRSMRSRRLRMPLTSSGSPTLSNSVMRGLSEPNGSWKIIWISCAERRQFGARHRRQIDDLVPPRCGTAPARLVGSMARRMQRAVVVLPQPLSPTRPSVSPSLHSEAHVVHSAHMAGDAAEHALRDREELAQPANVEQRRGGHAGSVAVAVQGSSSRRGAVPAHARQEPRLSQ